MNLQLSDGTTMQIPDDATPEAIRNYSARGEAHIKANPAPAAPDEDAAYNARNTVGRFATDALLGIPDMAITAKNLMPRPLDWLAEKVIGYDPSPQMQMPTLAPKLRSALNVAELPEDAPLSRKLLESGAANLPYAAPGLLRSLISGGVKEGAKELVKHTVVPTFTGHAGAETGGAVGGERGRFIGGIFGGAAPSAKQTAQNWVQGRYVGKGDPNAPAIQAAADRLGIQTTAGALGNYDVQKRENNLAANSPGGLAASEQTRIREDMTGAGDNLATQRGATGGSIAEIGDDIRSSTTDRLAADRQIAQNQQQAMEDRVGVGTQIPVTDITTALDAGTRAPGNSAPQRENYEYRRDRHLNPIINRDQAGVPILDPQGNVTAPYGALKQFGTDLGRSFDQGRYPPASTQVYGQTAETIGRGVQDVAGVPRADYNAMQDFYRGVEGEGGLRERLAPYDREPQAAHDWTLEGGRQNPERVQTFATETAGDPRQNRVFGNYLQQKVGNTLGAQGRGAAQGPNKFAEFVEKSDPRFLDTVAGPQAGGVRDLATLARGVDVPAGQRSIGTSMAGVGNTVGRKFLSAEVLRQLFSAIDPSLGPVGAVAGWTAAPVIGWAQQRIMQSDAAKRGLRGEPMLNRPMTIDDLVRNLNVISQNQNNPRQVE